MGEMGYEQAERPVRDRRRGATDELREATDVLHNEIDMLTEQLAQALRADEPSPIAKLAEEADGQWTELDHMVARVKTAAGRISNVRARLAV